MIQKSGYIGILVNNFAK